MNADSKPSSGTREAVVDSIRPVRAFRFAQTVLIFVVTLGRVFAAPPTVPGGLDAPGWADRSSTPTGRAAGPAGRARVFGAGGVALRGMDPESRRTTPAGFPLALARILRPPLSRAALLGETVTLSVAASGPEGMSYQWLLDGVEIPGATHASLKVGPITLADLGAYRVLVGTPDGVVTSQPAWLKLARWNELVVFDASISFKEASNGDSWVEWFGGVACLSGPGQIKIRATGGATGADVRDQIQGYLGSYKPGTNTLFAPWFAGISADLAWNRRPVGVVVSNYLANLTLLAQGGGRVFLLPTVMPLYWDPIMDNAYARGIDYADLNARIDSGIARLQAQHGLTVHRFDFWGLCSNVLASPSTYGFTNVTGSANQLCPPGDPSKFLWWDGAHPTTAFHRLIAEETYRCLTEPLVLQPPVEVGDGTLEVGWRGGSGPFRLQQSEDLDGGPWETGALGFEPGRKVPVPPRSRFFRVVQLGQ